MVSVIRFQLLLVRLESIRIVRLDHTLERRWRVRQDVRAGLRHRQVGRHGVFREILVFQASSWMTEREEAAVSVGRVWRVVLDVSFPFSESSTAYGRGVVVSPYSVASLVDQLSASRRAASTHLDPHRASPWPTTEELRPLSTREELSISPAAMSTPTVPSPSQEPMSPQDAAVS